MDSMNRHYEETRSMSAEPQAESSSVAGGLRAFWAWAIGPAAAAQARAEAARTRVFLDTLAFNEVLPLLEKRARHLSYLTGLRKMRCPLGERHVARFESAHRETLPHFLERVEQATLGIRSREHHQIRDMLENIVLYDDFINDIYLRNLCGLMRDAIASYRREHA